MLKKIFSHIHDSFRREGHAKSFSKSVALVLFFLFCVGCCSINPVTRMEQKMIFHPDKTLDRSPEDIGLFYEDIFFYTKDKIQLNGWFIPAEQAEKTVLFFHGNAGNISHRLEIIDFFHRLNMNVFIIDYRGYGKSAGNPSEKGLYKDARASYDYLIHRPDIDPEKIIVYGKSLGGVAAIDLAANIRVSGLIVDSCLTSAKMMAARMAPGIPSFLLTARLDSINKIQSVLCPKLFIHSPQDEVIPYQMGRELYEKAQAPKKFLKIHGGHNDGFHISGTEIQREVKALLNQVDRE
ncbi:MAG: alpha/beta hydrolase [Candidatus Omnitrophica bacterium]|nr:alpha/beta hydrolase [Candidatus Omnitrophota bacterium]